MKSFAINGFGRIGRLTARIWADKHSNAITLSAINTSGSMDLEGWAHLLKYDTAHGKFQKDIKIQTHQAKEEVSDQDPLLGYLFIDDHKIPVLAQRDPSKLPWDKLDVDLVIESTGVFRTEEQARQHIDSGAKKVIISAPDKGGNVETIILGTDYNNSDHDIVSDASCTTNCTSPLTYIIESKLGIKKAMFTTTHAYTDSQNLQDGSHKDLRRARAAAENLIPTTTGAAKSTSRVIPSLKNKFDGIAIRVPINTGSLTDLTILTKNSTSVDEINDLYKRSAQGRWKGIIATTDEPLVSSDIVGRPESAIVDLNLTRVVGDNFVKIVAWYDNEWGFTNRLLETLIKISKQS